MQDFTFYFQLGTEHILTPDALDHILFVTALCLRYLWQDWKKVVVLVTAFTIGHSLTLALSALDYIHVNASWIEFLIPLTIAATCINNIFQRKTDSKQRLPMIYFFALFFGLIHGLAFAGQFLSLEGKEGLIGHLLAFNIGIEAAQLLIVLIVLLLSYLVVQLLKLSRFVWLRGASALILVISLFWAYKRFPYHKNYHDESEKTVLVSGICCSGTV
ncbi:MULTISPECIES: HupE/UreJ family protein [Niastella]|uniref:HupE/UreJ family protein n=1 Tax=Niastella soli TaxID=2821487 RepID=A0ABS3YUN3_9BACT|nr:HupE/UreJ family protein [Niastella soli]MBO9201115.1 HupE/UreJ family protein [Niastella soli]